MQDWLLKVKCLASQYATLATVVESYAYIGAIVTQET